MLAAGVNGFWALPAETVLICPSLFLSGLAQRNASLSPIRCKPHVSWKKEEEGGKKEEERTGERKVREEGRGE